MSRVPDSARALEEENRLVSVACIPAFNVEKTIGKTILQVEKFVDRVIVCDDGSEDHTAEIAKRMGNIVARALQNRLARL